MVLDRDGRALEIVGYRHSLFGLVVFTYDPQAPQSMPMYFADELTIAKDTAECVAASLTKYARL